MMQRKQKEGNVERPYQKLDKTGSTVQLAVVLVLRESKVVFFRLTNRSNSAEKIYSVILFKENMLSDIVCTATALCQTFLQPVTRRCYRR